MEDHTMSRFTKETKHDDYGNKGFPAPPEQMKEVDRYLETKGVKPEYVNKPNIHKFQQFKVMSWKLNETVDNGQASWPGSAYLVMQERAKEYFYGEIRLCEMPGQPISTIRATVGSELCMLHGPDTSIMLKDFYVKSIKVEVPDTDPFMWRNGHIELDPEQVKDDLRNTIWVLTFRYTSVELIKDIKQRYLYQDMINSKGWGKDNEDRTLALPPSNDKLQNLHDSKGKIRTTIKSKKDDL